MEKGFMVLIVSVVCQLSLGQLQRESCLPQAVIQVPITVQLRGASGLELCSSREHSVEHFSNSIEPNIIENYETTDGCKLQQLQQVSCVTYGRRGQRVIVRYQANLTCNDGCTRHKDNEQSQDIFVGQVNVLRNAMRSKRSVRLEENYNRTRVSVVYFKGRKGPLSIVCRQSRLGSIGNKLNLCTCPLDCPNPCSLPPETGLCRAYFPRFFHNATSGQCEQFIYGGCGGNQNNFETIEECQETCKVCTNGKVYDSCGTACPTTCDNKDTIQSCLTVCVEGCFCPPGMVELGDTCVVPEDCPVEEVTEPECPAGKVYRECGTACPQTCDNRDGIRICTLQCVQGCFCPSGMVELGDTCVAPEDCPTPDPCSLPPETGLCRAYFRRFFHNATSGQCERFIYGGCGGNQNNFETIEECQETCKVCTNGKVYDSCGTACPTTCDNKDAIQSCIAVCVEGCFCPSGMVELGESCVAPEDCPVEEVTEPECPAGKVYQECGTACPQTCDNKDEIRICTLQCVQGCFCPPGMVELGESCVAPEDCPVEEVTKPECPAGKVYRECGTACPQTCDNKDELVACTRQCVQGCFCPPGMVELGESCVAPEDCPVEEVTEPECPAGKVYQECGTACPQTCDNKDEVVPCTLQCVQGCFCPSGTVQHEGGCVPPDDCPNNE